MAERPDEFLDEDEAVEGGAVKSFLEHLEDLRWVLVKSAAATLIAMTACLFNVPRLVRILEWPLQRASHRHIAFMPDSTNQIVTIQIGATRLPPMDLKTNHFGPLDLGTNTSVTLDLYPVQMGNQTVLGVRLLPGDDTGSTMPQLTMLEVSDSFLSALRLAFFAGLILAAPFILYYIGQFVMPALKIKEKKYFLRAFVVGVVLFFSGVSFAYFVIMPSALKFAQQFTVLLGLTAPYWTFGSYTSFVIKFMLGMGLGFELPVVLLALVKIGLLDYRKLSNMRRYMIVGNLILGALLTTPEVYTQIFMAVALQVLFEASVWIAWYWEWKEKKMQKG